MNQLIPEERPLTSEELLEWQLASLRRHRVAPMPKPPIIVRFWKFIRRVCSGR